MARAGDVVGVHLLGHTGDQRVRLREEVAVELTGGVGPLGGAVAVDVRVTAEERVRVPDRVHDQTHDIAHVRRVLRDLQVAAAEDRRTHQVPAERIGTDRLHDLDGVGVVAELLRQLAALAVEHHAVAHDVAEGVAVEQRDRQHVHGVEPAAGLSDVFDDEVRRAVGVEPLLVLEGVVHLGEGHRARLEPAVEHLRHATHRALARRVVGVRARQLVDAGAVQVVEANTEVTLDLVEAAVHVGAGVGRVIGTPHRDGGTPESVAADRPVAGALQPAAELAVAHVERDPVDVLVGLDQAVLEVGDLHVPARHGLVDDRRVGAPAMRVVVVDRVVADELVLVAEALGDDRVGLEHVGADHVGDLRGVAAGVVDGRHQHDAVGLAHPLVVLAVAGRGVHDPGAVLVGDEVVGEDAERVGVAGEVGEERGVGAPCDLGAGERGAHLGVVAELGGVATGSGRAEQHEAGAAVRLVGGRLDDHVVDRRADGEGQVRGQRPRRGRPGPGLGRAEII